MTMNNSYSTTLQSKYKKRTYSKKIHNSRIKSLTPLNTIKSLNMTPPKKKIKSKKKQRDSINILSKKHIQKTTFVGYPLDLLFGMLYLKRKFKHIFGLPFDIRKLIITYIDMLKQKQSFTFVGCIIYRCKNSIINKNLYKSNSSTSSNSTQSLISTSSSTVMNSSSSSKVKSNTSDDTSKKGIIIDVNESVSGKKKSYVFNKKDFVVELPNKLSIDTLINRLNSLNLSGKKFTAIPLIIRWSCSSNFSGHANILLFDLVNKTIERFEPYGKIKTFSKEEQKVSSAFDFEIDLLFKKYGYKYIKSKAFLPKKGPQHLEELKVYDVTSSISSSKENDPEGFCGAWSLWYVDLRLSNQSVKKKQLIKYSIKRLVNNQISLRAFIRNYSRFIIKQRTKLLNKLNIKNFKETQLKKIMYDLNTRKTSLEQYLKTNRESS